MRVPIVSIGNSKGIRIPKAVLRQCGIEEAVHLEVEEGTIILVPEKEKPRAGWREALAPLQAVAEEAPFWPDDLDPDFDGWEWP